MDKPIKTPTIKLKKIVYGLITIFLLIWLSSFVPVGFEFISYILMFLFLVVGVVLIVFTFKSKVAEKLRSFLLLTGFASVLLIVSIAIGMFEFKDYYAFYEVFKDIFSTQIDLFVVTVLFLAGWFWVGAIGSLIMLRRKRK